LRDRLRVHGVRVADAVDAMAQALRDYGMQVPAAAASPLDETDIETGEASCRIPPRLGAATAPAAAAAASIAASAASAAATAPSASVDADVAASRRRARSARPRPQAVSPRAPTSGRRPTPRASRATPPRWRARRRPRACRCSPAPIRAIRWPWRSTAARARWWRCCAHAGGAARRRTPLPLARDELQVFISTEGWPLAALRAQLNTRSPTFRHAVRLSLALGSAYFIGLALPWASHPHWLVLSVAVVLRGNLEQTLSRRNDRVLGTMIGCLLVLVLAQFGAPWLSTLAFLAAVGIAHSFTTARYLVTAAAASVMALMQAHMAAPEGANFGVFERSPTPSWAPRSHGASATCGRGGSGAASPS
jgi:hypothetical protein